MHILVSLPLTYIDEKLVPYFDPPLKDDSKQWGAHWQKDLSSVKDFANKYTFVESIRISPDEA